METIALILYEIIIEGLGAAIKSKKIPIIVRLLIASILCGPLIALGILGIIVGINALRIFGTIILGIISLGFIALWIFLCIKIIHN